MAVVRHIRQSAVKWQSHQFETGMNSPNPPAANSTLPKLLAVLAQLAADSQATLKEAIDGNEEKTRAGVDRVRQGRAALYAIDQESKDSIDSQPQEIKSTIQGHLDSINQVGQFISQWCLRYRGIQTYDQMLQTEEGCNILLDELVPLIWDWRLDILIFPGWADAKLIKAAAKRGQERICIFLFGEEKNKEYPENVFFIEKKDDAFAYFSKGDIHRGARVQYITIKKLGQFDEEAQEKINREYIEEFHMAFIHRIANINTVKLQGLRLLQQGLGNLTHIADAVPFSKIGTRFEGMPMVIVSPGPSLDKNIHLLRELKGRALIVAPAQSALALTNADIIPDIIVVADPNAMQYLLKDVPMDRVSAVILAVTCHPKLYEDYAGKIIVFNANLGLDHWISDIFKDTISLPAGGSVSTDALCMGVYLRCSPIILMGQDLSFTEKQYSSGTVDGQVEIIHDEQKNTLTYRNLTSGLEEILTASGFNSKTLSEPILTLPGFYGGKVKTKSDYAIFHSEFQKIAAAVLDDEIDIKLWNCTEGGAYIEGFDHIPLSEAINRLSSAKETNDVHLIIQSILECEDSTARRMRLKNGLLKIRKDLQKSQMTAQSCLSVAQRKSTKASLDKLSALENNLKQTIKRATFISLASQEKILNALQMGLEAKTIQETLLASIILYRIVLEAAEEIIPIVSKTIVALDTKK